jgi:hypothetical protein
MPYVPNATEVTQPVASQPVESAALEFRALKAYLQQILANATIGTVGTSAYIDLLRFLPDPASSGVSGRLFWDEAAGAPAYYDEGGNKQQLGQPFMLRVRNSTGAAITKRSAVYVNGATGQVPTIMLADADAEATSGKTLGLVLADIANNDVGYVVTGGLFVSLDTSDFVDGDALWLSAGTPGTITTARPSAPNHAVFLGYCIYAHPSAGVIYVNVQNGHELEELHDVLITAAAAGQMIRRRADNLVWENFDLLAQDQSWAGSQRSTPLVDADLSFDLNAAQTFNCTPTAGGTLTFTNIAAATGQSGIIILVNGANYAIAAAVTTKISAASLAAISATGTYKCAYYCNGTNVYVTVSENLA